MAGELMALEAMEKYSPLGPDFLTWLCIRIIEGEMPTLDNIPLEFTIKGPITLEGSGGEATKVTLAGEEAPGSPEFCSALSEGKKLVRARLVLVEGADQYEFTLNGETFDFGSVKIPVPKVPDLDQYLSDRVVAFQHLAEIIDRLYEAWLPLRLTPAEWKKETAAWRRLGKKLNDGRQP
jgi:hypothetical protein